MGWAAPDEKSIETECRVQIKGTQIRNIHTHRGKEFTASQVTNIVQMQKEKQQNSNQFNNKREIRPNEEKW